MGLSFDDYPIPTKTIIIFLHNLRDVIEAGMRFFQVLQTILGFVALHLNLFASVVRQSSFIFLTSAALIFINILFLVSVHSEFALLDIFHLHLTFYMV